MRAVVLERYGSPEGLALRDVATPIPADDQVLVRVRAASLNAMDRHLLRRITMWLGRLMGMPKQPIRGADLAGTVEAVGKAITRFQVGDEVFGVGPGSCAEYAIAAEAKLARKPGQLSFEQAAAIPVAGVSALQGLRDYGGLGAGQRALVYGAGGGVGSFAVQIAKALGAQVTAVTSPDKLELMRTLGANLVLDYSRDDFARRAERYDVVFDLGGTRSYADLQRVLTPNGKLVLCGAPKSVSAFLLRFLTGFVAPGRKQRRNFMAKVTAADLGVLAEMAEAGKLTPVIDRVYPLRETPDAYRRLASGLVRGKVVIGIDA